MARFYHGGWGVLFRSCGAHLRRNFVLDRFGVFLFNARPFQGQVAQLVEQRTENPRVGGSIPPLATTIFRYFKDCMRSGYVPHLPGDR